MYSYMGFFNSLKMKYLVFIVLCVLAFAKADAQQVTGTWKTIDDESGVVKAHVEIYERDGKIYGKVAKILDKNAPKNALCINCDGELKNAPILGLEIIQGLERKGNVYKGGDILDPENGKTYTCKIWLDDDNLNQLKVRGYIAIFYRTQTWLRL